MDYMVGISLNYFILVVLRDAFCEGLNSASIWELSEMAMYPPHFSLAILLSVIG